MKQFYKFAPILLLICILSSGFAQTNPSTATISGTIIDDQGKAIDYAAVTLFKTSDSSVVRSAVTEPTGAYAFENVPYGDYFVKAGMMGYTSAKTQSFAVRSASISIPQIKLVLESTTIKSVDVVYKKPFIERKMDRLVVNVEGSSLNAGNTAMEVLERSPGVTIDKDDNISMKGKQGVMIMLDGKQTYMSSADVANMLRNMQSNEIESIELITSPSARYDAAGTSGIINIKTKKSRSMGVNGNATAGTGYGIDSKYNAGLTLNYRKSNFNAFGNYNYGANDRQNSLNLNREVKYQGTTTNFSQLSKWVNDRANHSMKLGADYFIGKNHTIGVLFNGYRNTSREFANNNTNKINNLDERELISVRGDNMERYGNSAYNLNYKGILDTAGKELTVDLDYGNYFGNHDEVFNSSYTTVNAAPKSDLSVKNFAPSRIKVKSFKADYTHPMKGAAKFETGVKASIVQSDNDLLLARLNNGAWIADPEYTNRFIYDEDIYAAYANFSKEIKNTGIQFGLRVEHTNSEGNSVTKSSVVARSYTEFFPSLSVTQKVGENHQLGLSYSRRIDRPAYDDLNPFLNFVDEYTFQKGNPYLKPQFSNSVDLSHTYKGGFTTTLSYSHTKDVMTFITQQEDDTQRTYATQTNLDEQQNVSINLYAPVKVAKWWNINNNLQVFHAKFISRSNGGSLNSGQTAMTYNMDNSFTLGKTLSADASVQYQSGLQYGIFQIRPVTVVNVGLKKSFDNNKFTMRLNVSDIFDQRQQRISTTYQNMNLNFTEKGETRIARITLSYRFGSNEIKSARNRSTGLESEAGRIKN